MQTTIDRITTDRAEYTRYERHSPSWPDDPTLSPDPGDPGVLRASVTCQSDPSAPITLTIESLRTGRTIALASVTTDPSDGTNARHSFDLETDPAAYDDDGINRAIHGTYVIRAYDPAALPLDAPPIALAESPPFRIAAVTTGQLRAEWLPGIDARDTTRVRATVHGLDGIAVHETYDIERGGYPLAYTTDTRALSWREGPPITIPSAIAPPFTTDLWNATLDARITATIDPARLPSPDGSTIAAYTMHDFPPLGDRDLARHIDDAHSQLAAFLRTTALEPQLIVTARLAAEFPHADRSDHSPRNWRRHEDLMRAQSIESGLRRIIVVHGLRGFLNETQVISIDASWHVVSAINGLISFVPSGNARYPAPTPFTLSGWWGWGGRMGDRIPAFWHIAATIGLPSLHDDLGRLIRTYIARRAAMAILGIAARSRQGALGSESFGRDGVSLNLPYTSGQYGIYTDQITAHKEWCDETRLIIARRMIGYAGVS